MTATSWNFTIRSSRHPGGDRRCPLGQQLPLLDARQSLQCQLTTRNTGPAAASSAWKGRLPCRSRSRAAAGGCGRCLGLLLLALLALPVSSAMAGGSATAGQRHGHRGRQGREGEADRPGQAGGGQRQAAGETGGPGSQGAVRRDRYGQQPRYLREGERPCARWSPPAAAATSWSTRSAAVPGPSIRRAASSR